MSEWHQLAEADVLTLGMAADEARRAETGSNVVSYLRVHVVTPDTLGQEVPEAAAEVRLHELPEHLDEAVGQVRALKDKAGRRRVCAYSLADLETRGWSSPEALRQLALAGLSDVAELPADRIADLDAAIAKLRSAGIEPRRITVQHPVADRRDAIITSVQRAVAVHPIVRRFAPLPRIAPIDKPTTGYEDVRMVAISRLALPKLSIEVDWSLYGPKLAQVALTFGADHLDAVSAIDDTSLGTRRGTIADVERNIRAAGFSPQISIG